MRVREAAAAAAGGGAVSFLYFRTTSLPTAI